MKTLLEIFNEAGLAPPTGEVIGTTASGKPILNLARFITATASAKTAAKKLQTLTPDYTEPDYADAAKLIHALGKKEAGKGNRTLAQQLQSLGNTHAMLAGVPMDAY